MTPAEVLAARVRLALTQAEAARLFGVSERTWIRWEGDEAAIPPPAALLLMAAGEVRGLMEWLKRRASQPRSRP